MRDLGLLKIRNFAITPSFTLRHPSLCDTGASRSIIISGSNFGSYYTMARPAPHIAEDERQEAPDIVGQKAQKLADQIRKSKQFIVFTGAGVSTSAGQAPK